MSVNIQTGNVVKIQSGNRVLISAPGPQGPAGADGASNWGGIGGTLSDQADLQSALDAKLENGDTASLIFEPGGLQLQDLAADHIAILKLQEDLSDTREIYLNTGDSNRTVELFANLTVSGTANVSGTNSGNVSLAGTPNYLTISGQTITRALINLGSHVTSTLPVANGGSGATTLDANAVLLGNGTSALQTVAPSTSGNVLTSNGTTWTSAAPAGATYATDLQARQGLSTATAIAPATLWSAIHDSLFTADFSRFVSTAVTGSGSLTTTGAIPQCVTGATANSTARGYWITQSKSGTSSWGTMDYSRPSSFGLTIMVGSGTATSTGIFRVWFGTDTNASSIAARGYGFEVRHHRVWIIAHDGTTLVTQDTGTDISSTSFVLNVMRCVNDGAGNISVYINNAQIGTALAGGPTTAGTGTLNILNLNGANAAANDIRTLAGTFTANVY